MPGATFCPKCGKRWRSERHTCQPSSIKQKAQREAQFGARSD